MNITESTRIINDKHLPVEPISKGGLPTQVIQQNYEEQRKKEEAFIKEKSMLHHLPADRPKVADIKFLMQLLGDAFIGEISPLQGNTHEVTLNATIDFLERALKKADDPFFQFVKPYKQELQQLLEQYREAQEIAKETTRITNLGQGKSKKEQMELIGGYAKVLQAKFSKKPGWFPGGWTDRSAGSHGVMIHIDASKGISIVNPGAGLNYHPSTKDIAKDPLTGQLKEEILYSEVLKVTGCNKERLQSVEFYQALLELNICSVWNSIDTEVGAEELYEGIVSYLGGRFAIAEEPNLHPEMYKKQQRSGTYALKSVTASLYYSLSGGLKKLSRPAKDGVGCYKQLKFQWQLETLTFVAADLLPENSALKIPSYSRQLVQDTCENLTRSAEKLSKKNQISEEQMQILQATVLDIQRRMGASAHIEDKPKKTPAVPTELIPADNSNIETIEQPSDYGKKDHIHVFDAAFNRDLSEAPDDYEPARQTKPVEQFFQKTIPPQFSPDELLAFISEWSASSKDTLQSLVVVRSYSGEPLYDSTNTLLFKNRLGEVISALPIPSSEEGIQDIWSKIPQDKIVASMENISTFLEVCINCTNKRPSPEDTYLQYTLLAILDKLARRLPENRLEGCNLNYYELLVAVRKEEFALMSIKMQKNFFKLMHYFNPDFSIEDTVKKTNNEELLSQIPKLFSFKDLKKNDPRNYHTFTHKLTKERISENQTFLCFSRFLEDPKVVNAIRLSHPDAHDQIDKIAALMGTEGSKILPKGLQMLQQAAANIVSSHLQKEYYDSKQKWNSISCYPSLSQEANPRTWDLNYHANGSSSYYSHSFTQAIQMPDTVVNTGNMGNYDDKQFRFSRAEQNKIMMQQPPQSYSAGTVPQPSVRVSANRQNRSNIRKKNTYQLELDQFRKLSMVCTDPFDELNRIIAFCQQHPQLLKGHVIQNMLMHSPFKPGRILSQLQDNPQYASELAKFFHDKCKHYRETGDFTTFSIVLAVGKRIHQFVEDQKISCDTPFPDFDAVMNEWILAEENSSPKKLEGFCHLLQAEDKRSAEQLAKDPKLLTSVAKHLYAATILSSLQAKPTDPILHLMQAKIGGPLEKLLQENQQARNEILDFLFHMFEPDFHGDWQKKYPTDKRGVPSTTPVYTAGKRSINLQTGTVTTSDGKVHKGVPGKIVNHRFFQKLMKDPVKTCVYNGQAFVINQGMPSELTVVDDRKLGKLYFYRTFGDAKYLFRETPDCLLRNIPLIVKHEHVGCWSKIDDENTIFVEEKGTFTYQANFKEDEKEKEEGENNRKRYGYDFSRPKLHLRDIIRLKDGKHWTKAGAIQSFPFFRHFEDDSASVLSFTNKEKSELEEIALPRLGIDIDVKSNKFYVRQYPGFYLVENQPVDGIEESLHTLQMRNDAGDMSLLVPRVEIEAEWEGAHSGSQLLSALSRMAGNDDESDNQLPKLTLKQKNGEISPEKPLDWIEYQVKDGKPKTRQGDAKFYQVYLHVLEGKFEEARLLLQKCYRLQRLSAEELEVLEWLQKALLASGHPAANALYLKLLILVEENNLKYPLSLGQEEPEFINLSAAGKKLLLYLNNQTNAPLHRLSEREEKFLLDFIEKKIVRKMAQLTKAKQARSAEYKELQLLRQGLRLYYSNRQRYLKSGDGKIGRYYFGMPTGFKFPKFLSTRNLLSQVKTSSPREIDLSEMAIITDKGRTFQSKYFTYYAKLKSCSEEERATFRKHLEFYKYLIGPEGDYVRSLINVAKNPKKYPSLEEFAKARAKDEVEFARKLEIARRSSNRFPFFRLIYSLVYRDDRNVKALLGKLIPSRITLAALFLKQIGNLALHIAAFQVDSFKEQFFRRFKRILSKEHLRADHSAKGDSLVETDKAFDNYFNRILEDYFEKKPEPADQTPKTLPSLDSSQVSNAPEAKLLKDKLQKEIADLEEYRSSVKAEETYTWKTEGNLSPYAKKVAEYELARKLGDELKKQKKLLKRALKTEKVALLWQVNDIPETDQQTVQKISQHGLKKQVAWDELQTLILSGNKEAIKARTHLSEESASRLIYGVADYLVQLSRLHQMNEAQLRLKQYSKQNEAQKQEMYLQNVVRALQLVRHYEPATNNADKLSFECANHYMYRKLQIEKLHEINGNGSSELLGEMPTGFGKTKLMVPTINQEKAEREHTVNVWPRAIEIVNAGDVQESAESSFGRPVDRFSFDRSTQFTLDSLKFLYKELKKGKRKGIALNTRSETLRALQLHLILSLDTRNQRSKSGKDLDAQIVIMGKILAFIRQESWASIDEAHQTLDPVDKLIYTIGSPGHLSDNQKNFFEELFEELLSSTVDSILHIRENKQALTQTDRYEEVKKHLIGHFRKKYEVDDTEEFRQFINGEIDLPASIAKHEKKEELCLLQGMLNYVLKESIKSYVDVKFGLSKLHINKYEYAIPFQNSDTPKENEISPSQFKNPHETMVKTYLTYLHKGLSVPQVKKLIRHLQAACAKEASLGLSMAQSETNKFFKTLLPDYKKVLLEMQDADMEEVAGKLKADKRAIFYYIRQIIAPQIKLYSKTLVSSVQNFRSQFKSSLSLTATPQDAATHGPNTKFIPMKGTSGQVTHLMLMKCGTADKVHITPGETPKETLNDTIEIAKANPKVRATIDIGAQFRGLNNREIAVKLCEQADKEQTKAVLFFDEASQNFMVMEVETGHIHDPRNDGISPEERYTIYDQGRSVGSDIKQAIDAIALLTMGKDTTKAAAGQGAGRMRQWHMDQGTEWVVPKPIAEQITPGRTPTPMELLLYLIENHAKQEAEQNYQAQILQMDNEIRQAIIDKILNTSRLNNDENRPLDANTMAKLYKKFKHELMTTDSLDPVAMYGTQSVEQPTIDALTRHHKKCMARAEKLSLSKNEKAALIGRLKTYPGKWDMMALPLTVKSCSPLGLECEVLQEVEVEAQVEVQAQTQSSTVERTPQRWDGVDLFKSGWEKPLKLNPFFAKVSGILGKGISSTRRNIKNLIEKQKTIPPSPKKVVLTAFVLIPVYAMIGSTALYWGPVALALFGIAQVFKRIDKHRATKFSARSCTWKVRDLMGTQTGAISASKNFFSPQLLASNNFYVHKVPKIMEVPQIPLDEEQKPIFEVMVIQDELSNGKKQIQMMLIDQNDTIDFRAKLKKDIESGQTEGRKRKVGIYDLSTKIVSQGSNGFTLKELESNPEFVKLLAEAKLLNGEIDYTDEELAHIERRAKAAGIAGMHKFFVDQVLPWHQTNSKIYPQTKLAKILGAIPKKK